MRNECEDAEVCAEEYLDQRGRTHRYPLAAEGSPWWYTTRQDEDKGKPLNGKGVEMDHVRTATANTET
jgi:hypothetical protein